MKHMSEAVGIEDVLRIIGTADLAHPDHHPAAGTDPQTSLQVKQDRCGSKNREDQKPRPKLSSRLRLKSGMCRQDFSRVYLNA